VILHGALDRARASRLLRRVRCHAADDHGNRRLYRIVGCRGIGAEVLADLLDLLGAEMLLHGVEERHDFLL
jgi:hypothetical protein